MNKVILKGNLTKDIELQTTNNGTSVTKFTVAVQRRFANADGERETDFINCVAWRNTAEFLGKYFSKGKQIIVCGAIQTRTYEADDGTKRYVTEVLVDEVDFCGRADGAEAKATSKVADDELRPIDDDSLPF